MAGDDELRQAVLRLTGTTGTWKLAFPDKLRLWEVNAAGSPLRQIVSEAVTSVTLPSSEQLDINLRVEGVEGSLAVRDLALVATFTPSDSAALSDRANLTVSAVDVDTDSDNNDGFNPPGGTKVEGDLEQDAAAAGKYVGVNNDDSDRDGAADTGDGFNLSGGSTTATAGERFTPVFVSLNKPFDITRSTVRFTYRGDDPLDSASNGTMRLWKGSEAQRGGTWANDAATPGDYVGPGDYTAGQLGFAAGDREVRLWLEGIAATNPMDDGGRTIYLYVDPDGPSGPEPFALYDDTRVTVVDRTPTGLTAMPSSPGTVVLDWADGKPDLTRGYKVYRSDVAGFVPSDATLVATLSGPAGGLPASTFTHTGVAGGTWYYKVVALDPAGTPSVPSAEASVTVANPPGPATPAPLTAVSIPGTGVRLNWADVADETAYHVFRRTTDRYGTLMDAWVQIGQTAAGVITYTDATVADETWYSYAVAAVNTYGSSAYAEAGPVVALSAAGDYDGDGLDNLDEYTEGTDPGYFDSDGDLLPDGWEADYGLDPLDGDENADGIPDYENDFDGDGLNNGGESNYGTNPNITDTDGDGASDATEAGQGSDPLDPSDLGEPPPDDMKGKFRLTVGDQSGSHSERWALQVGDVRQTAPGFGEVGFGDFWFDAGESYDVRLHHLGSKLDTPDFDWTAGIAPAPNDPPPAEPRPVPPHFFVDPPHPILGVYGPSTTNPVAGKVSKFHIPLLDADVDSDNKGGFTPPTDNRPEDRLERDASTGKLVAANAGDLDKDGVPDFADFNGIAAAEGNPTAKFVPLVLRLSANVSAAEPSAIKYKFTYDGATADALTQQRTGGGTPADPYVYTAAGTIRIWKKDGKEARPVADQYLDPGVEYTAEQLGLQPGGTVTLFIEGTTGSTTVQPITVSTTIDGTKWSGTLSDTLHVNTFSVEFLKTFSDQIPGSSVNFLPGGTGDRNYDYILMGTRADDRAYARSEIRMTGHSATLQGRLMYGLAKPDWDLGVLNSRYTLNGDVLSANVHGSNNQRTPASRKFVYGIDGNNDGNFSPHELIGWGPHEMRVVNYATARTATVALSAVRNA